MFGWAHVWLAGIYLKKVGMSEKSIHSHRVLREFPRGKLSRYIPCPGYHNKTLPIVPYYLSKEYAFGKLVCATEVRIRCDDLITNLESGWSTYDDFEEITHES